MKHKIALGAGLIPFAVVDATRRRRRFMSSRPAAMWAPPNDRTGGMPPSEVLAVVRASGLRR